MAKRGANNPPVDDPPPGGGSNTGQTSPSRSTESDTSGEGDGDSNTQQDGYQGRRAGAPVGHVAHQDIQDAGWLELAPNEQVLWYSHPHPIHYFPNLIGSALLMLAGLVQIFLYQHFSWVKDVVPFVDSVWASASLFVLLGIGLALWTYIRRKHHYYAVTTNKISERTEVFGQNIDPIHYHQISNVKRDQPFHRRLISWVLRRFSDSQLNIGHVELQTPGKDGTEVALFDVPYVERVSGTISKQMARWNAGQQMSQQHGQIQQMQQNHGAPTGAPQNPGMHSSPQQMQTSPTYPGQNTNQPNSDQSGNEPTYPDK